MSYKHLKITKGLGFVGVTSNPTDPRNGDVIYRSDLSQFLVYNNSQWYSISSNCGKDSFTLNSTDISNGYVDLSHVVIGNSINAFLNRLAIFETLDFSVSTVGSISRVTFGSLIGITSEAPISGDKLSFNYLY